MEDYFYYIFGTIIILSFLLPLGYYIGQNMRPGAPVKNFDVLLGSLELWDLLPQKYKFNLTLVNPLDFPVRILWVSESERSELANYTRYSCSLINGSVIQPKSNVTSAVDVTVYANPYNTTGIFKIYGRGRSP